MDSPPPGKEKAPAGTEALICSEKDVRINTADLLRIERRIVASFVKTLDDFCATMLDNGTERNREWVVGDLQNNPGKSCAINLNTGLWCDPAEGQKGNAKQLWCALFGIDPRDRFAIVEGIRAWILKGELPDGSALGYRPEAVKPQPKGPQPAKNSAKEQARWLRIVEETREMGSIAAECFANERGLSVEVFEWLITQGYIGFYYSPKRTKTGRIWTDCEWAFPVFFVKPSGLINFYGLHLKWFRNGIGAWRYEPRGIPALPLVIGDLPKADLVVIGESTWDVIAYIDLYDLYTWSEEDGRWAAIATRGAQNVKSAYPAFNQIKSTAHLKVLPQNDLPDFNFFEALPEPIRAKGRTIRSPDELGCKDLNGWMRVEAPEAIKRRLKEGF